MAVAEINILQYTGAGPTKTIVTTPRMSTSDSAAPGTANPVPIPSSGFTYGYWMNLALTISGMNDATLLNNHQFYTDGTCGWTLGTSGELYVAIMDSGDNGCPEVSYDQATGTPGTTGDSIETHTYYSGQSAKKAAADDYTSVATLSIDTGDQTGVGDFNHVVLQAWVDTDATRGSQSAETLTFQYDEV